MLGRFIMRSCHIVLCCEADEEVGMGHAVRSAALLNLLSSKTSNKLQLTVLGSSIFINKLFPEARKLPPPDWSNLDWGKYNLPKIDLVLADIPFYRSRDWKKVRHPTAPLVVIDDHGGIVPANLVINGTVLPSYHEYHHPLPEQVFAGAKFALIRQEFASIQWESQKAQGVTIIVGGGNQARKWIFGIMQIYGQVGSAAFDDRRVTLVVGSTFVGFDQLTDICKKYGVVLHTGLSSSEMSRLLALSEVALVTAGMVLYEAITLGVPTVTYPQIPDLIQEAAWFASKGACIDLGADSDVCNAALIAVRDLLNKKEDAINMSSIQRELLDGLGMHRVAHEIIKILDSK